MKHVFLITWALVSLFTHHTPSCTSRDHAAELPHTDPMSHPKISIKVHSKTFTATLADNQAAAAFVKTLPLTVNMTELNGNEKYGELPAALPTYAFHPSTIQNGDIMLYGSTVLVLFYKTFPTSYSYTKLGSVGDVAGWAAALGAGNVTVTFDVMFTKP
ncbi:MAG: cyclophilin-like fold protein [Bacteroidia bacterium]|nr:cyclophilin-like fold protein [Bacteroidia bacterium]